MPFVSLFLGFLVVTEIDALSLLSSSNNFLQTEVLPAPEGEDITINIPFFSKFFVNLNLQILMKHLFHQNQKSLIKHY